MKIDVHPLTNDPTAAWKEISQSQRVIRVTMKPPASNVPANKVRIVCMSDTHSLTPYIKFAIPDGDIFIHAGDFTKCGRQDEVIEFNKWIGKCLCGFTKIFWTTNPFHYNKLIVLFCHFFCAQPQVNYRTNTNSSSLAIMN